MRALLVVLVIVLTAQLSGCFFFYIPGSVMDSVLGPPRPDDPEKKK